MPSTTASSSAPCFGELNTPPVCPMQFINDKTEAMRKKSLALILASRKKPLPSSHLQTRCDRVPPRPKRISQTARGWPSIRRVNPLLYAIAPSPRRDAPEHDAPAPREFFSHLPR